MYELTIFPRLYGTGLFREAEILLFNKEFLESLEPLINTQMGLDIKDFYKRAEEELEGETNRIAEVLREKIQLMHDVLDKRIAGVTLHMEYKQTGLLQRVWGTKKEDIINMSTAEREEYRKDVLYMLSTIDKCYMKIAARTKNDYDAFVNECRVLQRTSKNFVICMRAKGIELNATEELMKWIENKTNNMFYVKNEKDVSTNMGSSLLKKSSLKRKIECIDYRNYVVKNKVMMKNIRYLKLR